MSRKGENRTRFLALLLASLYVFSALFSGFFHTHTNTNKEALTVVKKAESSSKIINFGGIDDCFSSHFFNTGMAVVPSESVFTINGFAFLEKKPCFSQFIFCSQTELYFSLRAPPVLFGV